MAPYGRIKLTTPNVTLATCQIVTYLRSGPARTELMTGMAFWLLKKRLTCLLSFKWSHMFLSTASLLLLTADTPSITEHWNISVPYFKSR